MPQEEAYKDYDKDAVYKGFGSRTMAWFTI